MGEGTGRRLGGAHFNSPAVSGTAEDEEGGTSSRLHLQCSSSPKLRPCCPVRLQGLCSWDCLLLHLQHAKALLKGFWEVSHHRGSFVPAQ